MSSDAAPTPGMEALIPVINKLQDVFNAIGGEHISLPQIVVVGSQSSGKSSVLENIVGRDFLPRGSGIVTRRPLLLQLINLPPDDKSNKGGDPKLTEWGEFLHKPNEMFYDFESIRQEIADETERLTGSDKGISPQPIRLRIYSPHVLNLTLVDLPGMTRVAVKGQPADIEIQIRRMIRTYIEKPTTIILGVTAANTDIANSDALQLAREVDPEGLRTIGVITKIDIMDKGTDALDVLLGRVIPLKLGYVGVINRSQQDIKTKKSIRAALKSEAEYFSSHALYRSIASRLGTPYLTRLLNKVLMNHIRDCLPELKQKINKMMADAQSELLTYGDPMYDSKKGAGALLLQILTKFSTDYRDSIEGKIGELSVNELYGGARINYIFTEAFAKCLDNIHPNDGLTLNDIRTAIKNATGPRASLFVPEVSFELLVRRQVQRLEEPSLQCTELVFDELQRIVSQLESKELMRFQCLRERVVEVVNELLHKCKVPTRKMINNLINIELAYINTNHPDFVGGGGAISKIFEKMAHAKHQEARAAAQAQAAAQQGGQPGQPGQPGGRGGPPPGADGNQSMYSRFFGGGNGQGGQPSGGPARPGHPSRPGGQPGGPGGRPGGPGSSGGYSSHGGMDSGSFGERPPDRLDQVPITIKASSPSTDKEKFETELIQNLLSSYFDIVRKNIQDTVPKAIMYFLVNASKENIQNELVRSLYKEELFDELLEESPLIASRRKACKALLEVLKRAADILNEVRDFNANRTATTY